MLVYFIKGVFPSGIDKSDFNVVAGSLVIVPIAGIACFYKEAE